MRKPIKQSIRQPSMSNLFHIDFHNFIEKEDVLTEVEIAKEMGLSIGEIRYLKKNLKK